MSPGSTPDRDHHVGRLEPEHVDRPQGHRLGGGIDHPDRRLVALTGQGRSGQADDLALVHLHPAGHGGAQAHLGRRLGQAQLDLEGAGDRVGLRRHLAHATHGLDRRILGEEHLHLGVGGSIADHLRGHVEHRIAPVLPRQAHDHLAGLHHLAGLGAHLGHHALGIGVELGEADLILGEAELGLGRLDLRARGLAHLARALVDGARGEAAFLELALALVLVLGLGRLTLGRGEVGLGGAERVDLVLRVEAADQLAGRDPVADGDAALDHAAGQAEGEPRLVLGLDPAGEHDRHAGGPLLHGHGAHGADLGRPLLLCRLAGREQQGDRQGRPDHVAQGAGS